MLKLVHIFAFLQTLNIAKHNICITDACLHTILEMLTKISHNRSNFLIFLVKEIKLYFGWCQKLTSKTLRQLKFLIYSNRYSVFSL